MKTAFRIGSIPVRIHPAFLIMVAILGWRGGSDLAYLLSWFVVVLVSVLIHEMGHALVGKAFGLSPEIDLHGMGGTTSWPAGRAVSHGRSILISLAGPLTGMVAGAIIYFAVPPPQSGIGAQIYADVLFVNIGWGAFNLVPMLPLDGGNVLRSGLNAMTHGKGEVPARIVGIAIASLLALAAVVLQIVARSGTWWFAILGILFATQNYRALKDHGARSADGPLKEQLDAAYEALKQNDARRVLALSMPVIDSARSMPVRAEAIHLAAYGLLLAHRRAEADEMIARLPPGYPPHAAYAQLRAQVMGAA